MGLVRITTFKDGAEARLTNRRISIKGGNDGYVVAIEAITEKPTKPVVFSELCKNKLVRFGFGMSHDTMEAFFVAYLRYRISVGDPFNYEIIDYGGE